MTPGPIKIVAAVFLLGSVAGCASTTSAPAGRPGAADSLIAPAAIPTAPAGASPTLAAAWSALRGGTVVEASAAAARLPAGEAASAAGQALTGFLAIRRGTLAAAQDAFGAALAADPSLAQAAYGMGLVAQERGRTDLARQWYQSAVDADPGLTRASLALRRLDLQGVDDLLAAAERSHERGDVATAAASYRQAISLAPSLEGPYLRLAQVYAGTGDAAGAIAILEQGLRATGDSAALLERVGGLYRQAGRLAEAADAYDRLSLARPDDAGAAELAREARNAYEAASLPSEYRALAAKPEISREELAAILAINLVTLETRMGPARGVIISDVGNSWSTPFIQRMVEWGVLDVYQNDFMPRMVVRRSMLVEACHRVLEITDLAAGAPRPRLEDPPPEHLLYRQTQAVVGLGLMRADREGSIDLLAPVSGAEAIATVERLAALVRRSD